jgi:hypothetical protein
MVAAKRLSVAQLPTAPFIFTVLVEDQQKHKKISLLNLQKHIKTNFCPLANSHRHPARSDGKSQTG